jgi:hypothetical protein
VASCGLARPNRLGGDQSGEEQGDDGDDRDHPRRGAQRDGRRCWLLLSHPAWSGGTFCLLALGLRVAVGGERDTGLELRGGLGCHVGRDGRAILHAVDEPVVRLAMSTAPTRAVPSEAPR